MNFKRKIIVFTFSLVCASASFAQENMNNKKKLIEYNNFLEISKNYMEVHNVYEKMTASKKILNHLEMINFAMKPLKRPIKPIDSLTIHYAYPLKIFLPKNTTITKAVLSNSKEQPSFSQNMLFVNVGSDFLSGLLDVFYIYNGNEKSGKSISIKLDRYITNSNNIDFSPLYTQVNYYKIQKLDFNQILASLKPFEYGLKFSQVEYQGKIYDIRLVSIVKKNKILKSYLDSKYINCSLEFNEKEYNYYVK